MVATNIWFWVGFVAFVLAMLALDLGVFNRRPHVVGAREAARVNSGENARLSAAGATRRLRRRGTRARSR